MIKGFLTGENPKSTRKPPAAMIPAPSSSPMDAAPAAAAPHPNPTGRLQRLILVLTAALLALVLASAIGTGIWLWENRFGPVWAQTYPLTVSFADAKGVERGNAVQFAGVRVGTVERVGVENGRASIRLRMASDAVIPRGVRFVARPVLFSNPGGIVILANQNAGATAGNLAADEPGLTGEAVPDVADAFQKAVAVTEQFRRVGVRSEALLAQADRTTRDARTALNDPAVGRDLHETLASVHDTAQNATEITNRMAQILQETAPQARKAASDAARATRSAADLTDQMRSLARTNGPQVSALLADTRRTTANTARITERGASFLPPPSPANAARTAQLLDDIAGITSDLRKTTTRLDAITANGQTVLADPTAAADLRETLRSLRGVSEQAERASQNAEPLLTDPTVPAEVRDTLRQVHEISATTRSLLDTLNQLVQKAQGGGGGPLGKLLGGGSGGKNTSQSQGQGQQGQGQQSGGGSKP